VFTLDDRLTGADLNEEAGATGGRLYGICVLHSRLLTSCSEGGGSSNDTGAVEFESLVCYAFLTRFPLFDFFFQVIFDIITVERLQRMEKLVSGAPSNDPEGHHLVQQGAWHRDRKVYEYLPRELLLEVLSRLTALPPPKYSENIHFQVSPGVGAIDRIRWPPPVNVLEHHCNSAEWALPTLLSWMPPELILWGIGLLLCEVKVRRR
jgi:hypothetical protein